MARVDWVHEGLFEWGEFVRDNKGALLYPSQSAEQGMAGGSGVVIEPDMPDSVAMMEQAVLLLPDKLLVVVKSVYMNRLDNQVDQARRVSRELKLDKPLSRQRLGEMVYQSHLVIAGIYIGVELVGEKNLDNAVHKP